MGGAEQADVVIPGWSEGPDPESRDSGFDASHRPGMTISTSARQAPPREFDVAKVGAPRFEHASPSRRAMRPSYARNFRPEGVARPSREGAARPSREGAGNAGCPMHPQPRVRMVVVNAHEYSQRVHRNRPAFPHAMVLTVYFVLSPAIGCFATVASRIKALSGPVEPNEPPRDLTPASRRQDHTTSPSADSASAKVINATRLVAPKPRRGRENSAVVLRA
jgi:hypothetical protein